MKSRNQPADDGTDCSTDCSHAKKNENIHYLTSLLKRKLTADKGAALARLYQKEFGCSMKKRLISRASLWIRGNFRFGGKNRRRAYETLRIIDKIQYL